jgi:hypothetical protein
VLEGLNDDTYFLGTRFLSSHGNKERRCKCLTFR